MQAAPPVWFVLKQQQCQPMREGPHMGQTSQACHMSKQSMSELLLKEKRHPSWTCWRGMVCHSGVGSRLRRVLSAYISPVFTSYSDFSLCYAFWPAYATSPIPCPPPTNSSVLTTCDCVAGLLLLIFPLLLLFL